MQTIRPWIKASLAASFNAACINFGNWNVIILYTNGNLNKLIA